MNAFLDAALSVPFAVYALLIVTGVGFWIAYLAIPEDDQ